MINVTCFQEDNVTENEREGFASAQRQLLHFQEDSATDERRQIKGEVAIFIAVDKYVVVFEIYQPVHVAMTKGG